MAAGPIAERNQGLHDYNYLILKIMHNRGTPIFYKRLQMQPFM